ncbi:hypothetical protein C6P46_000388 [Rhodotorula mucilaginosa]|uniref:DNA polymerase n=1 Tax=Rhodotorula mucilaginosa TaxID=5537 RepID=A0A9P6VUQ3_RHOMI|nr:hypothetical protein C6P46_000388 [Rhodotorula mucilaginosa]
MPARVISNDPGDADSEELCQGSLASTDADEQQLLRGPAMPSVHHFACFRESPRPCVNQELVDQLAPLRSYRFLKYGTDHEKFISYATAVSVIIGTPFRITSVEQARKLPKIGPKLINKIEEFLKTGKIQEAQNVLASNEYKVLTALNTVHGIGSKTAVKLYEDYKVRTLDQALTHLKPPEQELFRKYHADLSEKFVKIQLNKIQRGSFSLLCGVYRRGKEESNDVDILITFPHAEGVERGVLRQLVQRLRAKGLIPPDGILGLSEAGTNRDSSLVANKPASRIDALDRAMVIFRHPADAVSGRLRDKYRRVDLIVSRWGSWGSAVVGWTGSTQFERDLRRHAERQGYKFDSGGIRTRDTDRPVEAKSEEDVFRVLGLKYIPPELRNADP